MEHIYWTHDRWHTRGALQTKYHRAAVIPGGCTSKIQPLDVCINKPFKEHFRHLWMNYMQENVSSI